MLKTRTALIGTVLLATACGGATTPAADLTGRLNVVLSDNPAVKFAGAHAPTAWLAHHKAFSQNYFHGRLAGTHQVALSRNGRDWVSLGAPAAIDLELQNEAELLELHPDVEVPAGTYAFLRLTSTGGTTTVEPGAEIGGEVVQSPMSLTLGSGDLVVETRLSTPIFVAPGSLMTLAIDLNSEGWLSEENLGAGRIPATDIEAAISVTPHERLPALVVPPRERST